MIKDVPYWKDTFIYSVNDLNKANYEQKQFYSLFKSEFIKGNCLDIDNNLNYAFILLFDLAQDFKQHKDYDLLYSQYKILGNKYPIISRYTNGKLLETLYSYNDSDFLEITVVKNIIRLISKDLKSNQFVLKPIDWILSLLKYERHDEKNLYLGTLYQLTHIFHKIGLDIAPNEEVDNIRLNFGDTCVIFKNPEGKNISKTLDYELAYSFVKFATYIVQADQVLESDLELLEGYLRNHYSKDNALICNHLIATLRWHTLYKKQRLNRDTKNLLNTVLSFDIRSNMAKVLAQLARLNGETKSKRIDRLKQVLPLLGITINDIQLHQTPYSSINKLAKSQDNGNKVGGQIPNRQLGIDDASANHDNFTNRICDEKLITSLTDRYRNKENISDHPIIQELQKELIKEFSIDRFVIKPLDWIFKFFSYSPYSPNSLGLGIYEINEILSSLGLGVMAREFVPIYGLKPCGICILYDIFGRYLTKEPCLKTKTKKEIALEKTQEYLIRRFGYGLRMHSILRSDEYKPVILYIQLITKIIQEDEFIDSDYQVIDKYLVEFNDSVNLEDNSRRYLDSRKNGNEIFRIYVNQYILAYARLFIYSTKQIFSNSMKRYVENELRLDQRNHLVNSLIHLACPNGEIRTKRIETLEKILPVFGYDISNIHSDIHRILTDHGDFVTIEKTTDASEYLINTTDSFENGTQKLNVSIDTKKLHILERQSQEAQNMLSDIFVDDAPEDNTNTTTRKLSTSWKDILKILSTKQTWSRNEVVNMCTEKGLILGAVLEQINDIAFEKLEEALVEDDGENIYVNLDYTQELL